MEVTDDEMRELKSRMDAQDRYLHEILFCLKGSESLNIEGALPALKRIERELQSVIDWKNLRGKIDYWMLAKVVSGAVGVIATIFGMFAGYRQIFP